MCGRYSLQKTLENLKQRYGVRARQLSFSPRPEVFPANEAPVIIKPPQQSRQLQLFRWGFSPSFASNLIINARGETVEKKATFKKSFYNRRCLIPADGFFEWMNTEAGKIKHQISLKNTSLFSLGGIYDTFTDNSGNKILSFCIITVPATQKLKPLHHRMPVILSPEQEETWLNPEEKRITILKKCLFPDTYPDDNLFLITKED